jgi:OOP family OmpA-OmpF porin
MMRSGKVLLFLAVIATAMICVPAAFAKNNVSILRFNPAPDGGKYVNVEESNTLKQWKFNVGISFDYAFEPLEYATVEGARRRGIIDDTFEANAFAAVAFTDWLTLGANFPLVIEETFFDPLVPAEEVTQKINKALLGDARIEMKFRLLDIERYHVGISIVPFLYIPTGNTTYFVGTGQWSPGGMLVIDGNIKDRLFLSLNAGYRMFQYTPYLVNELNPNAFLDDTLILNLGAHVRLSTSWAILGEATSDSVIKGLWQNQPQNPAEFAIGMRYHSHNPRGLTFTFMGGGGITHGVGAPNYRVSFMVNYRRPKKLPPLPPDEQIVVEEKIVITQRIHFEFDKAVIRPVSYPVLNDVALLLQQNPQIGLVRVEGHTDWIGNDEYNQNLSERRANAVRDHLTANGIWPDRLTAIGFGESRPIADNNTVEGRARNRRTEFTVVQSGDRPVATPQRYRAASWAPPPRPSSSAAKYDTVPTQQQKVETKYIPPTVQQAKPETKYVPPAAAAEQAKGVTKYVPPTAAAEQAKGPSKYVPPAATAEQAKGSAKYVPPTAAAEQAKGAEKYVPPTAAAEKAKGAEKYLPPTATGEQTKTVSKYVSTPVAPEKKPPPETTPAKKAEPLKKTEPAKETKPAAPAPEQKPQAPAAAVKQPVEKPVTAESTYTRVKGVIYFPLNGNDLTPEAKAKLKEIANYANKESSVIGVRFEAFPADQTGETGNNALSAGRAGNAKGYFTTLIKAADRKLGISSFGFTNQTYGEGENAKKGKVVIWVIRKFESKVNKG